MKKILQLIAIVTLLSAHNGYASLSKQKLNVRHQVLTEQIKEQEKSVAYYQKHYKQNPTDANKAYLENVKQILRVLKHSGNTIYAEINATGTSKTLLKKAPLKEQHGDSSGSVLVEKLQERYLGESGKGKRHRRQSSVFPPSYLRGLGVDHQNRFQQACAAHGSWIKENGV